MMKFFRKHNRKILGVLMALLMIVFLGGSALESMLRPQRNELIAQTRLGPITESDRQSALASTGLLERMGMPWSQPMPGMGGELTTVDWVLLSREAAQLGTQREALSVRSLVADATWSERIEAISRAGRVKKDRILEAIGEFQTIRETAQAVAAASIPSEAEIRGAARLFLENVKIRVVILTAGMFTGIDRQFSEEEITSHFAKHRDRDPGRGMDFGYRMQPAVQLQFIKIDYNAIAAAIGIANLEAKARKFFDENRENYPPFFKLPDQLEREKAAAEAAATPEQPAKAVLPFREWEDAKQIAILAVRNQYAEETVLKIADWLILQLTEPWIESDTGENRYKKAPPGQDDIEVYEAMIGRLPKNLTFPGAVSVDKTDFFTAQEAPRLQGIMAANVPDGRGLPASTATLAFRTQGLVPRIPEEKNVNPNDYLAMLQTCNYPVKDGTNNVYVFRVIATREARTPESVDEVREQVITDLHMEMGMKTALARAQSLQSCRSDMSLLEAYESDAELAALKNRPIGWGSGFFEPPPFSRTYMAAAARNQREPVTFVTGGVGPIPAAAADRCFELEHAAEKTMVVEVRSGTKVMLIEWVETIRPTEAEFLAARDKLVQEMNVHRMQTAIADWLTPEKIRARNGFEPVTDRGR